MPTLLSGLSAVVARYDGYLLDQYGVLHDGRAPYPGVLDCLERLRAAGRRVLVLTNSGKRAAPNRERLARIGIAPELYDELLSSGELVRDYLAGHAEALRADRHRPAAGPLRCLLLGAATAPDLLDGLEVATVGRVEEADFLLLASLGDPPPPAAAFDPLLRAAAGRGLTLVCANPDLEGITPQGRQIAPGTIALRYRDLGGPVVMLGKPHPFVYRRALARLRPLPPARVLAVGDSLAHDVAGAHAVGLDSLLILEGLHGEELAGDGGRAGPEAALRRLAAAHGAAPTYALARFAW